MATPIPYSGVVIPAFTEDRGTQLVDPISRSTSQKPQNYLKRDSCDRVAYISVGAAVNINQLVNCTPVQAGTLSISLLVPYLDFNGNVITTQDALRDFDGLAAYLRTQISEGLNDAIARGASPLPAPSAASGPGVTSAPPAGPVI